MKEWKSWLQARKMRDYERAVERQREEKELWKRKERVRKAHEANAKAKSEVPFPCTRRLKLISKFEKS